MTYIERLDGSPLAHARGYTGISLVKRDSDVAGSVSDPCAGPVTARSGIFPSSIDIPAPAW